MERKNTKDFTRLSSNCITFAPEMTNQMKTAIRKTTEPHPVFLLGERVEREGLVVIDNVTTQPLDGEPYISPYVMVALCQQGMAQSEYDMKPVEFHAHDMTIMRKGHVVRSKSVSADYKTRLIVMSDNFYEKFKQHSNLRFSTHSTYYYQHPSLHLTIQQVADRLGFSELASFSRFFKRETGLSPTEFRER